MKNKTKPSNAFKQYLRKEKEILSSNEDRDTYRSKYGKSYREELNIPDSNGDVEIYSAAQVNQYLHHVDFYYNSDQSNNARKLLEKLRDCPNRKSLAPAPSIEAIENLRVQFPNFIEAIEYLTAAAALSSVSTKSWFQFTPLLLAGPPGIGKTAFCQEVARLIGVDFRRIDIGCVTTGAILNGLSFTWSNGHIGEIYKLITSSQMANPLVMLDELDKMPQQDKYPIEPSLLALLEQENAKSFKDEAILVDLNCSYILWIATANNIEKISAPIRSRFHIVNISYPDSNQSTSIIHNIYANLRKTNPWGCYFDESLDDEVVDKLRESAPRQMMQLLKQACGKAALRKSTRIERNDLKMAEKEKQSKIGFV